MNRWWCFLLALAAAMHASCSDIDFSEEGYQQAIRSGLAQLPEAHQMDEVFGKHNVDHFISYSGSVDSGSVWSSEVYFAGRYTLTMQAPVKMDRRFDRVMEVLGQPEFYLIEVAEVEITASGQVAVTSSTDLDVPYPFGVDVWERIYESQGDFSAAGIHIKENEPIEDFDILVQSVRRDRIQVER